MGRRRFREWSVVGATAATMFLAGCASPILGAATQTRPGGPSVVETTSVNTPPPVLGELEYPPQPCFSDDGPLFESAPALEAASDVFVRGEITSLALNLDDVTLPQWVVELQVERVLEASSIAADDSIAIRMPRYCGDAAYGDSFVESSEFVFALAALPDGSFTPVSFQGVIPVLRSAAIPLPGAHVTISQNVAEALGAPLPLPPEGEEFVAAEIVGANPPGGYLRRDSLGAAWSPEPGVLLVFTPGSSNCPWYASAQATPVTDGFFGSGVRITVSRQLELRPDGFCHEDATWYTSRVAVPDGIDEFAPLPVYFVSNERMWWGSPSSLVVPPREQTGVQGEAAWTPTTPEEFNE